MKSNVIRIHPSDNVAVASREIREREQLFGISDKTIFAKQDIPTGHKVALEEISEGHRVVKYGESIGAAEREIHSGEHVHTHNLKIEEV